MRASPVIVQGLVKGACPPFFLLFFDAFPVGRGIAGTTRQFIASRVVAGIGGAGMIDLVSVLVTGTSHSGERETSEKHNKHIFHNLTISHSCKQSFSTLPKLLQLGHMSCLQVFLDKVLGGHLGVS